MHTNLGYDLFVLFTVLEGDKVLSHDFTKQIGTPKGIFIQKDGMISIAWSSSEDVNDEVTVLVIDLGDLISF